VKSKLPPPPKTKPFELPQGTPQITQPGVTAPGVKVERPVGTPTFAFLNRITQRPLLERGKDISGGVWGRILQNKKKGMGHG
jgi:hypothetical protein